MLDFVRKMLGIQAAQEKAALTMEKITKESIKTQRTMQQVNAAIRKTQTYYIGRAIGGAL